MNFLEAQRILASFTGGEALQFLFAMSGTADQFDVYLRACAARYGRSAEFRTLPFNTLAQALLQEVRPEESEVFLLMPWDFAAETDWRSGLPARWPQMPELLRHAASTAERAAKRHRSGFLYLPAPIPPLFPNPAENVNLVNSLNSLAASLTARVLSPKFFSLGSYLASGCPVSGAFLGEVAEAVIELALSLPGEPCKVIVTDLDHTLWHGVIADDGVGGIQFSPEGLGYRHFIYQSLLAKLRREGVLLAAVSRNDPSIGLEPLRSGRMLLREDDFIGVVCSYHAKSAQIRELADRLNLALDSFVFVDDNPVELAEVSSLLPQVHCLQFPAHDEGLLLLFAELSRLFRRSVVTAEDRDRTEMYRRRLEHIVPAEIEGADLTEFLRGLQMTLTIHDRSCGGRERAVQLINKTNQFNLNGRRVTDQEIAATLGDGARLYVATLADRNGSHGEILACLVSSEGVICHFVMSCRVFQRRVEYAFLAWLAAREQALSALEFLGTPRNGAFRNFLKDPAFKLDGGQVRFDAAGFATAHAGDVALFDIEGPLNG